MTIEDEQYVDVQWQSSQGVRLLLVIVIIIVIDDDDGIDSLYPTSIIIVVPAAENARLYTNTKN